MRESDDAGDLGRTLRASGWESTSDEPEPGRPGFGLALPSMRLTAWLADEDRVRLRASNGDAALEARVHCGAGVARLAAALPGRAQALRTEDLRTYLRALLDQGVCASVEVLEAGCWLPLAESIALEREGSKGLVLAVLGAAGWEPDTVDVPGQDAPVPARRHVSGPVTRIVVPVDVWSFVLHVTGRPPLRVGVRSRCPEGDHLPELLHLLIDFQDRLGTPAGDRAFWDALFELGTPLSVVRGDRLEDMLDWTLLDEDGQPTADAPESAPLKLGTYTLGPATDWRRVARETLEGGGLYTYRGDAPMAVGALYNAAGLLKGTPYWPRLAAGVSLCLTHPDLEVRAQALFFFSDGERCSLPGAERVEEVIAGRPELFPPGRTKSTWGVLDFAAEVWLALQYRADAGSTRATEMLARLPDPFAEENARRAAAEREAARRWSQVRRTDEPHPTVGETLWTDLIQRLRARPARKDAPCPRCAAVAPVFETEESASAELPEALSGALPVIADQFGLRECSGCGALFEESSYGPPAADDLFARTIRLERVSTEAAVARVRGAWLRGALDVRQVVALVAARAVYLDSVPGLRTVVRGGEWRRFIYREGDFVLDAWYDGEHDALEKLDWVTLGEFEQGLARVFGSGTVPAKEIYSFGGIPGLVIEQARARLRLLLSALEPLADETMAVAVNDDASFLVRHGAAGWQLVVRKGKILDSFQVESEQQARGRLDAAAQQRVKLRAQALAPRLLARIRKVEGTAQAVLARIDAGEACKVPLGLAVSTGRGYAYVLFDRGHRIENLVECDRETVLADLVSGLCGGQEPKIVKPNTARARVLAEDVPALVDPERRWELLRSGRIAVGGGPTSDSYWLLVRDGDRYRYEGSRSEWVDDEKARAIVVGKRYGWLKERV